VLRYSGKKSPLGDGLLAIKYQSEYLREFMAGFPDVVLSVAITIGCHFSLYLKVP